MQALQNIAKVAAGAAIMGGTVYGQYYYDGLESSSRNLKIASLAGSVFTGGLALGYAALHWNANKSFGALDILFLRQDHMQSAAIAALGSAAFVLLSFVSSKMESHCKEEKRNIIRMGSKAYGYLYDRG